MTYNLRSLRKEIKNCINKLKQKNSNKNGNSSNKNGNSSNKNGNSSNDNISNFNYEPILNSTSKKNKLDDILNKKYEKYYDFNYIEKQGIFISRSSQDSTLKITFRDRQKEQQHIPTNYIMKQKSKEYSNIGKESKTGGKRIIVSAGDRLIPKMNPNHKKIISPPQKLYEKGNVIECTDDYNFSQTYFFKETETYERINFDNNMKVVKYLSNDSVGKHLEIIKDEFKKNPFFKNTEIMLYYNPIFVIEEKQSKQFYKGTFFINYICPNYNNNIKFNNTDDNFNVNIYIDMYETPYVFFFYDKNGNRINFTNDKNFDERRISFFSNSKK